MNLSDGKPFDAIEREYMIAINQARSNDDAHELSIGLSQYQKLYKAHASPREVSV